MESSRSIRRVPTLLGPVGMGTVAILFFDIADRTAALLATWPKPLPDKLTSCGLPALSSLSETLACLIPVVFGLNVTLMVQDFPAATLVPQSCVSVKSTASTVTAMLVMFNAALPVLVSVIGRVRERPTVTIPKLKLAGISFTVPTVRVMVASVVLVTSAAELAVRVTVAFAGTVGGAL